MKHKLISLKISSTSQTQDLGGPHFAHPCSKALIFDQINAIFS